MNTPRGVETMGLAASGAESSAELSNLLDLFQARNVLEAISVAIYTTDADGRITFYNQAAVDLWGCRPEIGKSEFCGSWKLYRPDGSPLPHDQCPMAIALKERRPVRKAEAVAERPDGTRVPFMAFPTPLYDQSGNFVGAVNVLVDISEHKRLESAHARLLAAVVNSSDDAIVTKDPQGIVTSWNRGAERIFGYSADEIVGKPITLLFPQDRIEEEARILARIRNGERIDHYDTVRRCKDGTLIDISLTISPIQDENGAIVGASKIARDISERRKNDEQQKLLLREMDHRIKNLFTLVGSMVNLSTRSAPSADALSASISSRLGALSRAHALTMPKADIPEAGSQQRTTLHALIKTILSPYSTERGEASVSISGPDFSLGPKMVTPLALLFNEFATNAAKYGSLTVPDGTVSIECAERSEDISLTWTEHGGPPVSQPAGGTGFGSILAESTVTYQLGGTLARQWRPDGLVMTLSLPRTRLEG
jgi:PAS domain S-box-containing protein